MDLFGVARVDENLFAEVARAIFAHTFLNLGNDASIEGRALAAAPLLRDWLERAIAERRKSGKPANNLTARLVSRADLDDDGIRRTLGGMLVGSIDTTVTAFAKIICVACDDPRLAQAIGQRWHKGGDIYGLCLEALRRWPHNPILLRSAAVDTELAGTPVKRGDRVFLWTQAAMLDPQAFPDPERLLPDRPRSAYLHFGAGLHPCAGREINALQVPGLVGPLLARGVRRSGRIGWAGPFPDRLPVTLEGGQ
jgi:cytochrome P450